MIFFTLHLLLFGWQPFQPSSRFDEDRLQRLVIHFHAIPISLVEYLEFMKNGLIFPPMKTRFSSAKEIFHYLVASLDHYDPKEASAIAFQVLEHFGISRMEILMAKEKEFLHGEELHSIIERLNSWEPIQYILEESYFLGRKFFVNPSVLIPRPETEELVQLIIRANMNRKGLTVLDIGCGTGCIAVSLAKELPECDAFALDKAKDALDVTEKNAKAYQAQVTCIHADILREPEQNLPLFDLIVSNPPYVLETEKSSMRKNVTEYEPSLALYVPEEDPLRFYNRIADFTQSHLKESGQLYFEINERFGREIQNMLLEKGFTGVEILKDIHDKDRFATGRKTN